MSRLLLAVALLLASANAQAATLETVYGRQGCTGLLECSGDYEALVGAADIDWTMAITGWDPEAYDPDCAGPCEYLELEDTL